MNIPDAIPAQEHPLVIEVGGWYETRSGTSALVMQNSGDEYGPIFAILNGDMAQPFYTNEDGQSICDCDSLDLIRRIDTPPAPNRTAPIAASSAETDLASEGIATEMNTKVFCCEKCKKPTVSVTRICPDCRAKLPAAYRTLGITDPTPAAKVEGWTPKWPRIGRGFGTWEGAK